MPQPKSTICPSCQIKMGEESNERTPWLCSACFLQWRGFPESGTDWRALTLEWIAESHELVDGFRYDQSTNELVVQTRDGSDHRIACKERPWTAPPTTDWS